MKCMNWIVPDGNSFNWLLNLVFFFNRKEEEEDDENGRTTRTFIKMTKEMKKKTQRNEFNVMKTITFDFIFI